MMSQQIQDWGQMAAMLKIVFGYNSAADFRFQWNFT